MANIDEDDELPTADHEDEKGGGLTECGWVLLMPLTRCVAKLPCCTIVLNMLIVVGIIAAGYTTTPITVEPNFDSFVKSDVDSSLLSDGFQNALDHRTTSSRRLQSTRSYGDVKELDVIVYYELTGTHNLTGGILNQAALRALAKLERELRGMDTWQRLCADSISPTLCEPGLSYVNYGLASQVIPDNEVVPTAVKLDGKSWGPLPLELAMKLVNKHQRSNVMFNSGFDSYDTAPSTSFLRSVFRFRMPYGTPGDSAGARKTALDDLKTKWGRFIEDDVMPKLDKGFEVDAEYAENVVDAPRLHVYYAGTDFKDIEVLVALRGDMQLAGLSFAFVVFYLVFHTRSIFQSFLGLFAALLAVPLAFAVCALFGNATVSFASFLADRKSVV